MSYIILTLIISHKTSCEPLQCTISVHNFAIHNDRIEYYVHQQTNLKCVDFQVEDIVLRYQSPVWLNVHTTDVISAIQ